MSISVQKGKPIALLFGENGSILGKSYCLALLKEKEN